MLSVPRASNIYHLYANGKRILSGTVKYEVIYRVRREKMIDNNIYHLTSSGDNSFGEHEVLGWRHAPQVGDIILLKTGLETKINLDDKFEQTPTTLGYYIIELPNKTRIKINYHGVGSNKQWWDEV